MAPSSRSDSCVPRRCEIRGWNDAKLGFSARCPRCGLPAKKSETVLRSIERRATPRLSRLIETLGRYRPRRRCAITGVARTIAIKTPLPNFGREGEPLRDPEPQVLESSRLGKLLSTSPRPFGWFHRQESESPYERWPSRRPPLLWRPELKTAQSRDTPGWRPIRGEPSSIRAKFALARQIRKWVSYPAEYNRSPSNTRLVTVPWWP